MQSDTTGTLDEHAHSVPLPAWITGLCRLFAGIGGVTLLAIMLMTVTSVILRTVTGKPIPGDFELVEIGCAITIFCFLPWCQSTSGNVLVDFFTQKTRNAGQPSAGGTGRSDLSASRSASVLAIDLRRT